MRRTIHLEPEKKQCPYSTFKRMKKFPNLAQRTALIFAAASALRSQPATASSRSAINQSLEPAVSRLRKLKPNLVLKFNRYFDAGDIRYVSHSSHSSHGSHASHSSHVSGHYGGGDDSGIGALGALVVGGAIVYGAYQFGKNKRK